MRRRNAMTYPTQSDIQDILIEFSEVGPGWIYFTLIVGKERYDTRFSVVYDPVASLKWLEALATDVYQSGFWYDIEGKEIVWSFAQTHWDKGVFRVTDFYSESETDSYIISYADRKQIIKSLYLGFLRFFNSDRYKSEDWEIEYMWERLTKAFNTTYDQLVDELIDFDQERLKKVFFNANPTYYVSYPQASDKGEELNLFVQDTLDKADNKANTIERVDIPMEWNIPEDYDYWTREKKLQLIKKCLTENVNPFDGEKPEVFRSKLIETFLADQ